MTRIFVLFFSILSLTIAHAAAGQDSNLLPELSKLWQEESTLSEEQAAPLDEALYESPSIDLGGWFKPANWDGSFEVGINGAEGNSKNFNLRTGFALGRKTDLSEVALNMTYAKASANRIETQNFGQLNLNLNRLFAEGSPWSVYTNTYLLYDEFRPFDLRLAINSGIGYKWIDTDKTMFRSRFGAGVSREFGGPNNQWTPEANFGLDLNHQLTERQKFSAVVDYFPAWNDFMDYRLVSSLSYELLLDEANNLSLKLSILDNYDSTPGTSQPNDINYGLLLLWSM